MRLGFSYIGLAYLLILVIPNALWARDKNKKYEFKDETKILSAFERVGQVFITVTLLLFTDNEPILSSVWIVWLYISLIFMILYEVYWIRYFKSEKEINDFYHPILGIPIPGAILPVIVFLLLGIYKKLIWLILSAIIFGIGHIGIHYIHFKENKTKN